MDCEIYLHDASAASSSKTDLLLFFITGNPGLIEYYRAFLTHLYGLLGSSPTESDNDPLACHNLHVYGRNLAGYGTWDSRINFDEDAILKSQLPLGLGDQIEYVEKALCDTVKRIERQRQVSETKGKGMHNAGSNISIGMEPSKSVQVVLIGHSLGTYINLELLRRRNKRRKGISMPFHLVLRGHIAGTNTQDGFESRSYNQHDDDFDFVGVINICPTVFDLAGSPSGKKAVAYGVRFFSLLLVPCPAPQQLRLSLRLVSDSPPVSHCINLA